MAYDILATGMRRCARCCCTLLTSSGANGASACAASSNIQYTIYTPTNYMVLLAGTCLPLLLAIDVERHRVFGLSVHLLIPVSCDAVSLSGRTSVKLATNIHHVGIAEKILQVIGQGHSETNCTFVTETYIFTV